MSEIIGTSGSATKDGDRGSLLTIPISLDDLGKLLSDASWFALLDACDSPWVPGIAAARGPEKAVCLYDGDAADDFWDTAPYLVKADVALLDEIRSKLWAEPWGWFLRSDADLGIVKRHLKRFVFVRDEVGNTNYFRFYDPRVVARFLELAAPEDRLVFFGPMRSLATRAKIGSAALDKVSLISIVGSADSRKDGLIVRRSVMDGFSRDQCDVFIRDTARDLRAAFPELLDSTSDEELRDLVVAGTARGRGWGIENENDVAWLLRILLLHDEMDRDPLPACAARVLEDPGRSAHWKLTMIERWLAFGLPQGETSDDSLQA